MSWLCLDWRVGLSALVMRVLFPEAMQTGISSGHPPDLGSPQQGSWFRLQQRVGGCAQEQEEQGPSACQGPFSLPSSGPLRHCNILSIFALLRPFSTPTFHLGGTRKGSHHVPPGSLFSLSSNFPALQPARQSQTDVVLDRSGERSVMTHKVDTKTRP